MNVVIDFSRAFSADVLKYKNTKALALSIGAPVILTLIFFTLFYFKSPDVVKSGQEGWVLLLNYSMGMGLYLLFPLFLILLSALMTFVEHNANTWKQLFSSPLSFFSIYFSKVLLTNLLSFFSILLFFTLTMCAGVLIQWRHPDLFHFESIYAWNFLLINLKVFVASMAMIAIQYVVSFKWKNIVVPFGVGIAGFVSALIFMNGWKYVKYDPFAFIFQINDKVANLDLRFWQDQLSLSLVLSFLIYLVGYLELRYRKVKE